MTPTQQRLLNGLGESASLYSFPDIKKEVFFWCGLEVEAEVIYPLLEAGYIRRVTGSWETAYVLTLKGRATIPA